MSQQSCPFAIVFSIFNSTNILKSSWNRRRWEYHWNWIQFPLLYCHNFVITVTCLLHDDCLQLVMFSISFRLHKYIPGCALDYRTMNLFIHFKKQGSLKLHSCEPSDEDWHDYWQSIAFVTSVILVSHTDVIYENPMITALVIFCGLQEDLKQELRVLKLGLIDAYRKFT